MQRTSVKIGLIGLGKMGQNHLRVLSMLKSVELVFVHDLDAGLSERLAAAHGVETGFDLQQLLPRVDAVVIATPTSTHLDYVRQAAPHVKHLLVEKPLAATVAESEEIAALAERHGLQVQVGFIERFNPAVEQLRRVLQRSSSVVSVDFTRTNKLSARITDVDVVTDLMVHDIDLALHLNGPVTSVFANGIAEGGVIDFASALLSHANGRFSRIMASRITEKKIRSIQATCIDMFVDCELLRKELIIMRQAETRQTEGEPFVVSAIEEAVEVKPQEALLLELQAFVERCNGGPAGVGAGVADGLAAMRVCAEVQASVLR